MRKSFDTFLQFVFFAGILLIFVFLYLTRIVHIRADDVNKFGSDMNVEIQYASLNTVYQFEQEEKKLITRINILKADYASSVINYANEKNKILESAVLSELEKREKLLSLESIYLNYSFERKLDLIAQENALLERLRGVKCEKFCVYRDLPADF